MQSTKIKQQAKIRNPYQLARRFFGKDGSPEEWQDMGTGDFTDIETVQRQIRLLKANYPNRKMEVAFKMGGELRDYRGNITGKTITFG